MDQLNPIMVSTSLCVLYALNTETTHNDGKIVLDYYYYYTVVMSVAEQTNTCVCIACLQVANNVKRCWALFVSAAMQIL